MTPISSRHRAVFECTVPIRLYKFGEVDSKSIVDVIKSSITAHSIADDITCITTSERRSLPDPRLVELMVHFWGSTSRENPRPVLSSFFTMPSTWTPNMYLSAVYVSVKQRAMIVVDWVVMTSGDSSKYKSINQIHMLFFRNHEVTDSLKNILAPGYCHVRGGDEV